MQTTSTPTAQTAQQARPLFRVFLGFTALVLGLFLTGSSFAQTVYFSKASATNFASTSSWGPNADGTGVSPASISGVDSFVIANGSLMTLNANATVGALTIGSGRLTVSANTLTIANSNTGRQRNAVFNINSGGRFTVTGGTVNLMGRMAMASGGIIDQSGGDINVDGNNGGATAGSVPTGTVIVNLVPNNFGAVNFTGGTFTIVDPHVGTASGDYVFNFSYGTAGNTNTTTGHTFRFGDGVSTDGTTNTGGFIMYNWPGTGGFRFGNLVINGGAANRLVTSPSSYGAIPVLNDLTINANSELRQTGTSSGNSQQQIFVGRNLTNNGTLTTTVAGVYFGNAFYTSSTAITPAPSTLAQTVSGTGKFRNNTTDASSTANFGYIAVNNASSSGVTFSDANSLLCKVSPVSNTGTVSGTLALLNGDINLSGNRFILGVSTSSVGTLSYTAGGFNNGTVTRWLGTGTLTTSSTTPTANVFPFSKNGANRNVGLAQSATLTTAGYLSATYTDGAALDNTVSFTDAGYTAAGGTTINRRTQASWSFSTANVTGLATNTLAAATQTFPLRLQVDGLILLTAAPAAGGAPVITYASASAGGTHATPTGTAANPAANRTGITLATLTGNTFYAGLNSTALDGFYTVSSGDWATGSIWSGGVVPSSTSAAKVSPGHAVTVTTAGNNAASLQINSSGSLSVSSGDLSIAGGTSGAANGLSINSALGSVSISGGTLNVGTGATRVTTFSNTGTLNVTGGTLNVNGNMTHLAGSNFNQSGGDINIDGNNGSTTAGQSVAASTDLLTMSSQLVSLTGGTITILNPHLNGTTAAASRVVSYSNTVSVNCGTGHTFRFGNGSANQPGNTSAALGFVVSPFTSSGKLAFGNVTVNGTASPAGNRMVTFASSSAPGILGNLLVTGSNASLRFNANTVHVAGNVTVDATDTLVNNGTLALQTLSSNVTSAALNAQTVGGSGIYKNGTLADASTTGCHNSVTINNSSAGGVTFSGNAVYNSALGGGNAGSHTSTLTFTQGTLNVSGGNPWYAGHNQAGTPTTATISVTAGGFGTGSTLARWITGTGTGTNITSSALPTSTGSLGTLTFPFVSGAAGPTQTQRFFFLERGGTLTDAVGGTVRVQYNDVAGISAVSPSLTDGSYVIDQVANSNWVVSTGNSFARGSAEGDTVAITGTGLFTVISTNAVRVMQGTASVTGGAHQAGTVTPQLNGQRTGVNTAGVPLAATYYLGYNLNDAPIQSQQSGDWNDVNTWVGGVVPSCGTLAQVRSTHAVTLSSGTANCKGLILSNTGSLAISGSGDLTVGCTGNNAVLFLDNASGGTPQLIVSGGTLRVNGNINHTVGTTFSQSGGDIIVDGNDNNTIATSVASGTSLVDLKGTVSLSGGTLTVVDPHVGLLATDLSFKYDNATSLSATGHTLKFGNGVSTQATNNPRGFLYEAYFGSGRLMLGNLTIDMVTDAGNRFISSYYGATVLQVLGNMTVSSGEFRTYNGNTLAVGGNLVNNGTLVTAGTLALASGSGVSTISASTNAQTVSGTGSYVSNIPAGTIAAAGTGYVVGDIVSLPGGTFTTAATFYISAVNGTGGVTGGFPISRGSYTVDPSEATLAVGGSGTGFSITPGTSIFNGYTNRANFNALTVNNSNASGVTFSDANSLLSGANVATLNGTLTLTAGLISTSGNTLLLGVNDANAGSLTYTAGGFTTGSAFGRYYTSTGTGQATITSGSNPTGAGGRFPFIGAMGASNKDRSVYISQTTAPTTGGYINVGYSNSTNISTVATPFTDGAYTINRLTDANWTISTSGITGAPAYSVAAVGDSLFASSNANTRLSNATAVLPGTHVAGSTASILPVGQRSGVTLTDLASTLYLGFNADDIPFISVASGNWQDGSTWNRNPEVPGSTSSVTISSGNTVAVGAASVGASLTVASTATLNVNDNLTIGGNITNSGTINATAGTLTASGTATTGITNNSGASFTVNGGTVTVGVTPGTVFADRRFTNNGTLTVSSGNLNIFGNLNVASGSSFTQSGGTISVDGNAGGDAGNSVASGTSIVNISTATLSLTGGTLVIVDPHANSTASNAFNYSQSTGYDIPATHTFQFGDGISTDPGGNATNAFRINTWASSGRISFGNVVMNAGNPGNTATVNRFNTTTYSFGINGNLTVTKGDFRVSNTTYVTGNIINNDTLTSTSTLLLQTFLGGTAGSVGSAQTISGTGVFRNNTTAATSTASLTSLTIDNTSAGGVTLSVPLSVSGTLTLTNGIVNTSSSSVLQLGSTSGTPTAGFLSGTFDGTRYVNGPFARVFLASRTSAGTYTTTTLYPVADNATYKPVWADPTTTSGGPVVISAQSFSTNSGTAGSGVATLSTNRWEVLPTSGSANLTGLRVQLGDASIVSTNKIVQASSAAGAYSALPGTTNYTAGTPNVLTTAADIASASYNGYLAYGNLIPCTAPADQPSALVVSLLTSTSFTGTYSAAASSPTGYLVVRYPSGGTPTAPTDGTTYTVSGAGPDGSTGTVVVFGSSLSFSESGLTEGTTYDYYFYSFNNSGCAGPGYNTTSPYTVSVTTCAASVGVPGTPTASDITPTGFTASWTASSTSSVDYILDVATNSSFTTFVSGYQALNVGSSLSQAISGLSAGTSYFVRVRAVTNPGGCSSANSSSLTQGTPLVAPWSENFDALSTTGTTVVGTSTNLPAGWLSNSAQWSTTASTTYNVPVSSPNYLRFAYSSTNAGIWTPGFYLTGGVTYSFAFSAAGDGWTGWDADVMWNTTQSLTGATKIGDSVVPADNGNVTTIMAYAQATRNFTPATTGVYYFGLRGSQPSGSPWYMSFDNFSLKLPCVAPAGQATSLTFPAIGSAAINGSFTAASATGYVVLRTAASTTPNTNPVDGTTYTAGSTLGNATVVSAGTGTTFSSTGLSVSTTYRYTVFSYNGDCGGEPKYNTTSPLFGEATTLAAQSITSTGGGGLWSQTATWSTGFVPSINDNVTIASGNPVTIDTAAFAASLVIDADLTYQATTARTLTVSGDVTVNSGATFATAATGTVTTHVLRASGNLTNNGTLDFNTNGNTAGGRITFADSTNSAVTFAANGTTDIRTMTIDKGTSTARSVEITGSGSITAAAGFLTLTNGLFKVSANMGSNTFFGTAAYTIGATTGFWLNNASTTVTGQTGSPTNNGQLRVSAGTYNVGTASGNSMGAGTGAIFNIEGGALNVTGRLTSSNNVSYTQSGGTVTVSTVGNSSSSTPSFGFTSGNAANIFNMSGGSIVMQTASIAGTPIDYYQGQGTLNISGGSIQFGNASTAASSTFVLSAGTASGQIPTPSVVVGVPTRSVTLSVASATGGNINVYGDITINTGSTLRHDHSGGQNIIIRGNAGTPGNLTNDGTVSIGGSASTSNRIQFNPTTTVNASPYTGSAAHSYSGTGTFGTPTIAYPGITVSSALGLTLDPALANQMIVSRVNAIQGAITNANKITIGQGGSLVSTIQRGGSVTANAGTFDQAPTFNLGTGGLNLVYSNALSAVTTSFEVPSSRTVNLINNLNAKGLTISGGNLSATTVNLNAANITTDASNVLTVTGTTTTSISRGSYTAAGASSSGVTVTVTSTTGLNEGMLLSLTSGTGAFAPGTYVDTVLSATTFKVLPAPTTALSGASISADGGWVNGPLTISLPVISSTAAATTYRLPIGKTAFAGFDLVNPVVSTATTVSAEYFTTASGGTPDVSLLSLQDGYWQSSAAAGFDSARVRVNSTGIDVGQYALAKSDGTNSGFDGVYTNVGTNGISTTQVASDNRIALGYFAIGTKQTPMSYTSVALAHPSLAYAYTNNNNVQMLRVNVVTANNFPALVLNDMTFSSAGSTGSLATNVTESRLYYTGNSSTFSTATQVGSNVLGSSMSSNFTFTQDVTLAPGNNYFWLVYDVPSSATVNDSLDATCESFTYTDFNLFIQPTIPLTPPTNEVAGKRTIKTQLNGDYTIGPNETAPNFTTLTSAMAVLNDVGVAGPVRLLLQSDYVSTGETFPITINQFAGASATNTLTIKPNTGVTTSITAGALSSAVFKLNGADYVILDGSNNGTTSRNLTLSNPNTSSSAVVWIASLGTAGNGADNNTISNLNIRGGSATTSGIYGIVSASTGAIGTAASDNNNLIINNNNVGKVYRGISVLSSSSAGLASDGIQITNNTVGNTVDSMSVTFRGIEMSYSNSPIVSQNTILNMKTASSLDIAGIDFGAGVVGGSVNRNNISSIYSTSTSGYGAYGINFSSTTATTNVTVANNFIYDIKTANYSTTSTQYNAFGIRLAGGTNLKLYYNTVHLYDTVTSGTAAGMSAALVVTTSSVTGLDVRNNNFLNNMRFGVSGSFAYGVVAASSVTFGTINYNNYGGSNPNARTTFRVGLSGTTARTTLANWQTYTTQDAQSKSVVPVFLSNTDLHLTTAAVNTANLVSQGQSLAAVTTDYDGETRGNPSTIGADELVPCTGAIGGTAVAPATTSFCGSSAPGTAITASGYSSALGGTYQWESSTTSTFDEGTVTTISGANNPAIYTISPAVTQTTYYRLKVTCSAGTATDYSNVITITINSAPTSAISATGGTFYCNPSPQSITLNAVTDLVSPAPVYQWKLNGTAISGETNATLDPNGSTGSYTLDVTNTTTNCTTTSAATVISTANRPPVPTMSSNTDICLGGAGTSITASSTQSSSGSGTIGTGTVTNTTTTPYKGFWGSQKVQFMYTAAELTAAGLQANSSISSIQLPVSSFTSPYTFNGFKIAMKNSSESALTSTLETGLTTVYGPETYTLSGTAPFTVTHTLASPFVWNGTSNLVVEFCFDNNDGGGVSGNSANVTSSTVTGYAVYNSVDNSGGNTCESTSGTTSTSRVNMSFGYSTTIPAAISWSPSTGLSATTGSPVTANPTATQTYTATATATATGCTSTNTVTVTVKSAPAITAQPVAPSAFCAGSGSQQISVTATGDDLTYSWRKDGVAVSNGSVFSGQGTNTLTISSPSEADAGSYTVVVAGFCTPSETSDAVTVTVNSLPAITSQPPASKALCLGASDSLSVVATGTGITYSWRKNGVAITNNAVFSGQGTAQLNFTNPSSSEAGTYDVVISGTCTPPVTSNAVTVTVNNINTFNGTGNWTNVGNWSCDRVPLSTDNVEIAAGAVVTLNTNINITGTMNVSPSAAIIISPTREMSVASGGTINLNGASVTLKSGSTGTAAIGKILGTLSGASNVTIERYIPVYDASLSPSFRHVKAWRLLSVPTYTVGSGGQTIRQAWQENGSITNGYGVLIGGSQTTLAAAQAQGFDAFRGSTLQKYSGTAWINVDNTNSTKLDSTGAYFLFVRGNRTVNSTTVVNDNSKDVTLRTTGNIYQGNRTVTLPAAATNFSVAGNIYPSPVNFATLLANSSNINSAYHLWDPKRRSGTSMGGYQYFSATNSYGCTPCGGSFPNDYQNTTIQSGQGFFVQRTSTESPATITFTEAAKVGGLNINNLGFRPTTPLTELVKMDSRLYDASGVDLLDGNTVVFSPNYSNGVDGDDAIKMSNFSENFGIRKGEVTLAVEGRQPLASSDTIFFRIWNLQEQEYKLEFTPRNLSTTGLSARLEDTHLGTSTPIDLSGVLNHSFTVDATPGSSDENRFRIVFAQAGSGPLPVSFISVAANMLASGNVQVDWKVAAERNIRRYEVESSADGRVFATAGNVAATGNGSVRDIAYNWIDPTLLGTTRFYRVKSVGVAGEVRYSSIVKVSRSNVKPAITVSPNPVEGGIVNLQFKNKPEGRYNVNLVGNDGKVIFTAPAVHPGGNSTQLISLPVSVARGAYQFEIIAPDRSREVMTLFINTK